MQRQLVQAALLAQCLQSASEVAVRQCGHDGWQPEQRHVPLLQRATEPSMADRGMHVQEHAAALPAEQMLTEG